MPCTPSSSPPRDALAGLDYRGKATDAPVFNENSPRGFMDDVDNFVNLFADPPAAGTALTATATAALAAGAGGG